MSQTPEVDHTKEIYEKLPPEVLELERGRLAERIQDLAHRYELINQVLFEQTTIKNYGGA